MSWPRAFATWFLIAVAESIHGTLRGFFILPAIGDLRAHQFGILVGSLIIFALAWTCIRWIGAETFSEQLKVGALWVVLMIIFEVSLGLALGYSRERILADYNVMEGRLMILGMMFMLFAPALAAKARGLR